jgi:hypothetical protein
MNIGEQLLQMHIISTNSLQNIFPFFISWKFGYYSSFIKEDVIARAYVVFAFIKKQIHFIYYPFLCKDGKGFSYACPAELLPVHPEQPYYVLLHIIFHYRARRGIYVILSLFCLCLIPERLVKTGTGMCIYYGFRPYME